MDNLTHSLVGALIGQAGLKRRTGLAMPALIIGANIPDIDATCVLLGDLQHLALRRGITHGPIAWVLLPLLLAGALWWFDRWQARRGKRPETRQPVHFGWLYTLSFIACLTHPALDWLNVYGIRLLEPFSHRWFYGDVLFIIDIWLWIGMGLAIWLSLRREKRGGDWWKPARIAVAGVLAYIALNAGWSSVLTARLDRQLPILECNELETCYWPIIPSPVPFFPWQREMLTQWPVTWSHIPAGHSVSADSLRPLSRHRCNWPDTERLRASNPQLDAFLFWSRAPFAERAQDGSVLIRDARFNDPRVRDRFTIALPDVRCEELVTE